MGFAERIAERQLDVNRAESIKKLTGCVFVTVTPFQIVAGTDRHRHTDVGYPGDQFLACSEQAGSPLDMSFQINGGIFSGLWP